MTTRTFTDKNGNEWSRQETLETKKAVEELHSNNYEGPLYAPHPDIKKDGKKSN